MNPKTKLKDLKYEVPGIETNRVGIDLINAMMFAMISVICMLLIVIACYCGAIDSLSPLEAGVLILLIAFPFILKKVLIKIVLK